jgi:hypothetical protein
MRFLYLDDSGKADPRHPSRVVVFAGLSIDHGRWHPMVRQVTGAKAKFLARRGHPALWELKGSHLLSPNAWMRASNRDLCFELADILRRNGCHVYSVGFTKADATRPLSESWAVPLCFQEIAAMFSVELEARNGVGAIVCDWSGYTLDHQVSNCVQTFILRNRLLRIAGGVTYGSSLSLATIQVADVHSYAFRTAAEGALHHAEFVAALRGLRWKEDGILPTSERMLF